MQISGVGSRRLGWSALTVTALLVVSAGVSHAAPAEAGRRPERVQPDQAVTLLTGDRVVLRGGDPTKIAVDPAPGRQGIGFQLFRKGAAVSVIPADVAPAIAAGRLDRRLFDVTGLIKDRYDDAHSKVIPLIVTYAGTTRAKLPQATTGKALPAVNGEAVRLAKQNASGFYKSAVSAKIGIRKIWLDGKRKLSLDQSVPQIGAPTAWQAGYTGKGVTVAVLDSGIDATHPDLAPQLAGAANFTTEQAGDFVGHGTHVASTIAGTAAASNGKYKGVAPDAKLLDGKICMFDGCYESAILAGMDWAATDKHAQVINLSLGATDFPEIDPLEEAVNRLTASTGALFVIAAGNDGPDTATIESPGSADAALTVGAVDKQDQLADFSSRGPRVGDSAVKPDITAPGVGIVAAKSKNSVIGEPVGDQYLRLQGTSMATPHVAGAAALLAQEHPSWKATELKSALMASAKPAANQTVFEQGAGRVDLTKAITQNVFAVPGSLAFGKASWPHNDDTPVAKQLTYRNTGATPVTLHLTANLGTPDGSPAPAGALTLSANTLTVPAGSTNSVTVTSDTRTEGPDGTYSGRIVATVGDSAVVTPLSLEREVESYDLTIKTVGTDGAPLAGGFGPLTDLDSGWGNIQFAESDTVTVRLPKADYQLTWNSSEASGFYSIQVPNVSLTHDLTVVADNRLAKPIKATAYRPDVTTALVEAGIHLTTPTQSIGSSAYSVGVGATLFAGHVGEARPGDQLVSYVGNQLSIPDADGDFVDSPVNYHLFESKPGFYDGYVRQVRDSDLARIVSTRNATSARSTEVGLAGETGDGVGGIFLLLHFKQPTKVVHLVEPAPTASWTTFFDEYQPDAEGFPLQVTFLNSRTLSYHAAQTYRERWNAAAFVPTFGGYAGAVRDGDQLLIGAYSHSDADNHSGQSMADSSGTKVFRNGVEVGSSPYFADVQLARLDPAKAAYRVETRIDRSSFSTFSTRTKLTWRFTSAATETATTLPLRTIRYLPEVDKWNAVQRKPVLVVPFTFDAPAGATLPAIRKITAQVSGDDGKTWRPAYVVPAGRGGYRLVVALPHGAKEVSLRATATDVQGNSMEQTVLRAFSISD
ncbi:S8 family serine peptidase [Kribbella sp. NPDC006257]|uniref:S8 family serine peptidase n=1 Tax=Kribbella sp. NPDC006257 TaxID=3156738 RepID=UPI0033BA5523